MNNIDRPPIITIKEHFPSILGFKGENLAAIIALEKKVSWSRDLIMRMFKPKTRKSKV